jgi:hypothetical protein
LMVVHTDSQKPVANLHHKVLTTAALALAE